MNDLYKKGIVRVDILEPTISDFLLIPFILYFFLKLLSIFSKKNSYNFNRALMIYLYHFLYSLFFYYYTQYKVNDSITYFQRGLLSQFTSNAESITNLQTIGIFILEHSIFLLGLLNISYLSQIIIFGSVGGIGIVLIDRVFQKNITYNKITNGFVTLIILFPTLHFWSSGITKEVLAFLSIGIILNGLDSKNNRLILLGIFVMCFSRVHISFFLLFAYIVYYLSLNKKKFLLKIIPGTFFIIIIFYFIAIQYLGDFDVKKIIILINEKGDFYRSIGKKQISWYDTENLNFVLRNIKYLFYPIYNFQSILFIVQSLENSIILLFILYSIFVFFNSKKSSKNLLDSNNLFLLTAFVSILYFLSFFTSNVGISARQKWLCIIFLLFFLVNNLKLYNEKK